MDIKLLQTGKIINYILVIGLSVVALFLGTTAAFSRVPEPDDIDLFPLRRNRNKRTFPDNLDNNTRNKIVFWDSQTSITIPDIPTEPCGRSLTVQDIASSFHYALYNTSNRLLVRKAFKSLPLLLIYNGRRSEYISKMRIVLVSYFMNILGRTIFNPSLCVEACSAMQILTALQSGPLAHNYNGMLGTAGAIETLVEVLQIHMPTANDFFMDVNLVTRRVANLDGNVKRHIFEYLYSPDENALLAELSCSVLGRLCHNNDAARDYTTVLNGIILALAAHHKNREVALEAFTAIFNCRLIRFSASMGVRYSISLYDSIIKSLNIHKADQQIVAMCCQIIIDLLGRKFKVCDLEICESIVSCMTEYRQNRSIRDGVFDKLCEASIHLSQSNKKMREKFISLKIRSVIGEYDSALSPQRVSELYLIQIKFSPYGQIC